MKPIPKKFKDLVKQYMREHRWNMGMNHIHGEIIYMAEDLKSGTEFDIHATMTVDRRYLRGTLRIFPVAIRKWKKEGNEYLDHLIAHEVGHLLTQHLFDLTQAIYKDEGETKDAWEMLTEQVGRMSVRIKELELKKK